MAPKSRNRKIKKKVSRHIPKKVDALVKENHFFECAWCGEHLTDRHHITEFSHGGEHSVENLILLCVICHRKVHEAKILHEDLILRKSTHLKADRIPGGFKTTVTNLKLKTGGNVYTNTSVILKYKSENLISFRQESNNLLINLRFYNQKKDLIFWMSENHYWALSSFKITSSLNLLEIQNNEEDVFLRISENAGYLTINCKNYLEGKLVEFNEQRTSIENSSITGSFFDNNGSVFVVD